MEFLVAALKMGLLMNMGILCHHAVWCFILWWCIMVLLYPTSNTRAHSFFVMLNLHILEQNKSVVIFILFSTISLSVSICFDWCDFIHHSGVQGETTAVFSSVGGNVTLPCRNVVYPNCSSTTWTSSNSGPAVGLVYLGKIDPGVATHRAKRLSLVSNCSLHITDVTTEDAGRYTCLLQLYMTYHT